MPSCVGTAQCFVVSAHGHQILCGKKYTAKHILRKHTQEVHEGKRDKCPNCNKEFTNVKRHVESVHEGKKPNLCLQCGTWFHQARDLKRHISTVHEKERPYPCPQCGKGFTRKDKVKEHISSVHEGIKPAWEKNKNKNKNKP